ncbi:Flp pilus assembly complex ATPase component TadA [Candidatus Woesearchaeota archaeon]|mgnify:CR=1 FL=1|jgi:ATPase|nr:Flp pilus assembly complex ATPase component TadA [Candidatus Woesearchaeota archaeon]MBT4322159.1 Flp pilus assembly complex ATPase component TadA [Candidatus Woesearchaeota archaeon]MBT4630841.1 Flp pilus assembly complex ATPase component TadA [Candidatus Woesearchaeota archaeon]
MKAYVPDTSAIIEGVISESVEKGELQGTIIIANAVVSELEAQANKRRETGFLGLDELKKLQEYKKEGKVELRFAGSRPTPDQIKFAKSGEIDALIRQIAYEESAILITADIVQAESARVYGLEVKFIEQVPLKSKLQIEKYFDNTTMSVHLKEETFAYAKRGFPGNWKLVKLGKSKLNYKKINEMAKEIVEKARMDPKSFVEISRSSSTIIQYKNYRIVIVRKPLSNGVEITAIKPIKKLDLNEYNLNEELLERIKTKSRGVLIAGETGSGKSTLAQAIAEFYSKNDKITKTVESPRDLQLNERITQYSKNFSSSEEIHDILFLSRPDNLIFDEIRDTPDFKLFMDLRLAGSECLGVIHSATAIDAVQRFIGRTDTGLIPSIIDTIIQMDSGKVSEVLTLKMSVKVPTGMTESDLARPVIEVFDFFQNTLQYEIYSYGEETVIIPVEDTTSPSQKLAEKQLLKEIRQYSKDAEVQIISSNRANIFIPEKDIAQIIGTKGKRIENIEKKVGIKLTVKPKLKKQETLTFDASETSKYIVFKFPKNIIKKSIEFTLDDQFLFSAIASNKSKIQIHKKSQLGRTLVDALDKNKDIVAKL